MLIKIISKRLFLVIFIAVLILGFLTRFYQLGTVPSGLQYDEAQSGYNGFLLLHTGRNMNGDHWPLDIDYFGDFRPALSSYLTALTVAAFDLNVFSTRVPVAAFSVLLIGLTYAFTKLCFQNKKIAILAALFVSVSPFAVIFGRSSGDVIIDLCFELLGIICLIAGIKKGKWWFFVIAYSAWVLGYFTYQTSRFFTPIFAGVTLIFCYWQYRPSRKIILLAVLPLVCYLIFPFATYLKTPFGSGRFNQVSVFSFPEVQRQITEETFAHTSNDNVILTRLLHNKPVDYTLDIIGRYSIFFSPQTILFSITYPSFYFVPRVGAVTMLEYFCFVVALGAYLFRRKTAISFLPLIFLALAPIPSALTFEGTPHFLRAAFMIPFWPIIAAYGLVTFIGLFKKKVYIIFGSVVFFALSIFFMFHQYLVHQPVTLNSIIDRRTEMKDLALFLGAHQTDKSKILLSEFNNSFIYYYFFNKLSVFDTKVTKNGKYFTDNVKIDNIYFSKSPCPAGEDLLTDDYSYVILRVECLHPGWAVKVKDFTRSNGSVASNAYRLENPEYANFRLLYLQADNPLAKQEVIKQIDKTFIQ